MAVPAAVAVVAKKVVIDLLTKKKTWVAIGSILLGVVLLILMPLIVLLGMSSGLTGMEIDQNALRQQVIANLTDEQKAKLIYFETVMVAIDDEVAAQGLDFDPIKAEVIYMCALMDREKDSETFYTDYILCFAEAENDDQLFANITAKFGVAFTAEEKVKIIQLCNRAIESQKLPMTSLHNEIAELIKDDETPLYDGDFTSPFQELNWKECVSSSYGYRTDPVTGEKNVPHTGLDLAAPYGTPIYPIMPGKVLFVRNSESGYGKHIAVNHGGGYVSMYAHCSEILVSEGDEVTTETVIAKVGSTGKSTGDHCHLELTINGQSVNPKRYLK